MILGFLVNVPGNVSQSVARLEKIIILLTMADRMSDYPNIVLIVLDTLRRDTLPMYGGQGLTPNLEGLSKDGTVFQNATAPAPWTVPSHVSLLTGTYPNNHGVEDSMISFVTPPGRYQALFKKLREMNKFGLVERLNRIGYSTVGLSMNPWISPGTPFQRFFDSFTIYPHNPAWKEIQDLLDEPAKISSSKYEIAKIMLMQLKISELGKDLIAYRRSRKFLRDYAINKGSNQLVDHFIDSSFSPPFFLFMNFMDVHEPISSWQTKKRFKYFKERDLLNIEKIPERLMNKTREDYMNKSNHLDVQLGRLFKDLKRRNLYDDSLIIVTSDHGEALKEERKFPFCGHGTFLYDEIVNIPLIVKLPKNRKILQNEGYQSLTNINKFIVSVIDGNYTDEITEPTVHSEVLPYIHDPVQDIKSNKALSNADDKIINEKFYPREAIYKNGYKLVVNSQNGDIDELSFKGKKLNYPEKEVLNDLVSELENFVGKEKFVVNQRK